MLKNSLMKISVLALILAVSTGFTTLTVAAEKKHGVVIQMSENNPAAWNLALNNAKNIQQEVGKDKVEIEIVTYGPGINMFKFDSEVGNRLVEAEKNGVALLACANTMKVQKLKEKDMHGSVKMVPAGVVEIMTKQEAGWSYIKP